jgi:hypothetical protein
MKKIIFVISIAFAILTSCKKHDPTPPVDPLQSISIGADTLSIYVGGKRQIDFTTTPADYSTKLLIWTSSDSTKASVGSSGIVTAKVPGIVKITVSNAGKTVWTDCLVFVLPKPIVPPVDSLKIGLLARYDFNDSGIDSSGNGYNGTVYNITSATDRFGNGIGAYSFDGISSYISIPDHQSLRLNGTDFTINAWVKISDYGGSYENNIVTKRFTGANNGWALGITGPLNSPAGDIMFGPGGPVANAFGNKVVTTNQWHMVTVIYTLASQQLSTYVDGAFSNATTGILSPTASINALMYIGKDDPSVPSTGYFFNGSMDDIRIYSRAISKNQLQQLFMATN